MISLIDKSEFTTLRRDPLLGYDKYFNEANDLIERVPTAAKKLGDSEWAKSKDAPTLLRLTYSRARNAINLLTISYSAGADLNSLQKFYPELLSYYEEYALYSEAFNLTQTGTQARSPHIFIRDTEFERANRLLCFAILLGFPETVSRIMTLIDYNNNVRDGMLERLASCYTGRPSPTPNECARHLPYFNTLEIFDAPEEDRPSLMREYLLGWYESSRREPYYNAHARNNTFLGYWSWESAAITVSLGICDDTFRELSFYPRDLADYAKEHARSAPNSRVPNAGDSRARAGEPCPISGRWASIGTPNAVEDYIAGSLMKDLKSPYGLTVWRLLNPNEYQTDRRPR